MYAIDEESVEVDPFSNDKTKTFQLQDVVTHGNPNDKSFINHNLFTIGDGNDAIVDNNDSDEDDDVADVIDIDGVVDKQATAQSKFANFAFNDEKQIPKHKTNINKSADKIPSQIELQQKQHQMNATDQNADQGQQQQQHGQKQQQQSANNIVAYGSNIGNRQMTYKHTSK